MRIRYPRTSPSLDSKVVKKRVIGGDTDYCRDAFSFTPDDDGIASSYAQITRTPSQTAASVFRAVYLPRYNFSVMINSAYSLIRLKHGTSERFANYGPMYSASSFLVDYVRDGIAYYGIVGKHTSVEISDGDAREIIDLPYWLRCGVMRKNRLIGADGLNPLVVRWSAHLMTDWTEGAGNSGYVYLEPDGGAVVGAAEYDDGVVFVRERGITVMHARGDPRNFSLEPTIMVNTTSAALVNATCTAAGKVWFFSAEKMYVYDGSVKEVPLAPFVKGCEFVLAQSYDERYIYANCVKDGVPQFMEYDALTGTFTLFGKEMQSFWRSPSEALGTYNSIVVDVKKDAPDEDRFWLSEEFGSEDAGIKNLRAAEIDCDDTIEVAVIVDGSEACRLKGGRHKLFLHGSDFAFRVTGTGRIRTLDAEWEVSA